MRAVEQAINKRILHRRIGVTQHAGHLPDDRIHQYHRGDLSARQHKITDAQLFIDPALQ